MTEEDVYAGVPDGIHKLIDLGIFDDVVDEDDPAHVLWDEFKQGHCMCCQGDLGRQTVLIFNSKGICAGFCSAVCMTDMGNIGWLQEQHDDIVDRIKFRGGKGDGV